MKIIVLILALSFRITGYTQTYHPLDVYKHQIGKTWVIDATWGNGTPFKQGITIEYDLQNTLVKVSTKGFIDQAQETWGDRNFGVRKYDAASGKILFWEFDAFGGLTTGEVLTKDKDLWYIYEYGGLTIADIWEYQNENTYSFTVGEYENGELGQVYLRGEYKAK